MLSSSSALPRPALGDAPVAPPPLTTDCPDRDPVFSGWGFVPLTDQWRRAGSLPHLERDKGQAICFRKFALGEVDDRGSY